MSRLADAKAAMARDDWTAAVNLLADETSPEAAEARAIAHYGNGEFEVAVGVWESLYESRREAGENAGAGWAAANVALYLLVDTGLMAPVRSWVARADRELEGLGEVPAHALLAMVRTYERFMCGDPDGARRQARRSMELGARLNVSPAVLLGQVATARLLIADGEVEQGLAALDDAALQLMSGAVDPFTTGMLYCELVCAAQGLLAYDRAREWTDVMEHWRHGHAYGGLHGRCRVHRAELLRVSGPGAAAELEALAACDELRPWMRREFGWPLVELGNIRLRLGDLDGAEDAFLQAHRRAWPSLPGLALLRLEQGEADTATKLIADAVNNPPDLPWKERPPFGDLRLVPLLDAQSEIAFASGDTATATRAAARLSDIGERFVSPGLAACAALATARAHMLAGDPALAIGDADIAVVRWCELDAPYEAAVARVVLGSAYAASGDAVRSRLDWQAAHAEFESFGAVRRAAEVANLLAGEPRTPTHQSLTATMAWTGDRWRFAFRDTEIALSDLKGLQYLATLLSRPGHEFRALDLCGGHDVADPVPVIDVLARAAYRRRLDEVDQDIAEAQHNNDLARVDLASRDREFLLAELSGAVGLGGRLRHTGGAAERARTSVTRSLRYALDRLADHDHVLGEHLKRTVRTGSCCSYSPDTVAPINWTVRR
ncbi:hypothetical protein JGU71_23535 [Antrihabitans sp. YC3-6]|uniref:LuxR family transcriptional regulator n=1 Tax=Antrihabitans stalagmiti TaxID=2799499 RepID=A0A934NUJ8_9NOCA|nr:hypothetical protein [Antrihabitans stalagmiti]MBJ8341863.1 hypothetical protein [Antrihabitans stalagmiti]